VRTNRRVLRTEAAPAPVGPYSQGMVAGGLVFTVGVVGSNPATSELVAGGLEAQAHQALDNLEAILDAAGTTMSAIVKANVYLADMADLAAFNEIYGARMSEPYPPRTTVAVAGLPLGARVEIDCVALTSMGRT
jgi:2-iminobutanoate/2-iminopropanoate deaminase